MQRKCCKKTPFTRLLFLFYGNLCEKKSAMRLPAERGLWWLQHAILWEFDQQIKRFWLMRNIHQHLASKGIIVNIHYISGLRTSRAQVQWIRSLIDHEERSDDIWWSEEDTRSSNFKEIAEARNIEFVQRDEVDITTSSLILLFSKRIRPLISLITI